MKTVAIKEHETGTLISPETISAVVQAIAENFSPLKIVLFGSYATGHPTPDSDLDLLVIMESDLPRYKRAAPIRRIGVSAYLPPYSLRHGHSGLYTARGEVLERRSQSHYYRGFGNRENCI